jgi:hypothetical protein
MRRVAFGVKAIAAERAKPFDLTNNCLSRVALVRRIRSVATPFVGKGKPGARVVLCTGSDSPPKRIAADQATLSRSIASGSLF